MKNVVENQIALSSKKMNYEDEKCETFNFVLEKDDRTNNAEVTIYDIS